MADALYELAGDRFVPTEATRSPWHAGAQHGGPPSALAARAVEALIGEDQDVVRFSADLLAEIPLSPLHLTAAIERPGRKVTLVRSTVATSEETVITASAWAVRRADIALPPPGDSRPQPPPDPESLPPLDYTFREYADFFGSALDKRLIGGTLDGPGNAALWFRLRMPLVAGESSSPLQRLVAIADSGNGISWALPFERFLFVNVDLDLALARPPAGEWFAMASISHIDGSGRGMAESSLFDRSGWLGRATQVLFVDQR